MARKVIAVAAMGWPCQEIEPNLEQKVHTALSAKAKISKALLSVSWPRCSGGKRVVKEGDLALFLFWNRLGEGLTESKQRQVRALFHCLFPC